MGRPWSSEKAQAALARAILFSREQSAAYLQLVLLLQENEHLYSSTWYLVINKNPNIRGNGLTYCLLPGRYAAVPGTQSRYVRASIFYSSVHVYTCIVPGMSLVQLTW